MALRNPLYNVYSFTELCSLLNQVCCLTRTGEPDAPQYCSVLDITALYVILTCLPGYGGGEGKTLLFPVLKSDPSMDPRPARSSVRRSGQMVVITVTELIPRNNYTLYVYAKNSHGRSSSSVGLNARTLGRDQVTFGLNIYII